MAQIQNYDVSSRLSEVKASLKSFESVISNTFYISEGRQIIRWP